MGACDNQAGKKEVPEPPGEKRLFMARIFWNGFSIFRELGELTRHDIDIVIWGTGTQFNFFILRVLGGLTRPQIRPP